MSTLAANRNVLQRSFALSLLLLIAAGCKHADTSDRQAQEAPPAQVSEVQTGSGDSVQVANPQLFRLVPVVGRQLNRTLQVTGTVNPDVSRELPVLSLANGRVISLNVILGAFVHKGQLVMTVQSPDVTTAFDGYLKAVNDEHLTNVTLVRDKLLYDKGAI